MSNALRSNGLLNHGDMAAALGISRRSLYRLVESGTLPRPNSDGRFDPENESYAAALALTPSERAAVGISDSPDGPGSN